MPIHLTRNDIHVGWSAPDPTVVRTWVDVSVSPPSVKGWDGVEWVAIGGSGGGGAAYSEMVGDGAATSFDVVHGLGTSAVVVAGWEVASGDEVSLGRLILDDNAVRVVAGVAPATGDLRVVVLAAGGSSGGGGAVPIYLSDRAAPVDPTVWSDEFDGDTLGPAWTALLPSGTLDLAVGRGVLSAKLNAQGSGDMAGVVTALPGGLPAVFAIETAYRVWVERENYLMAGPFIADGGLETSNVTWWMPYWGDASFNDSLRSGTPQNIGTNHASVSRYPYGSMGIDTNLMRLVVDTADNSVRVEKSLDGVQWSLHGSTTFDRVLGFTPTHFGFGVSTWGGSTGSWSRLCSIDYMRVYDLGAYVP